MIRTLIFSTILLLTACKGNTASTATEQQTAQPSAPVYPKDTFAVSKVLPNVPLRKDASQSFALYLPSVYNDTSKLPVIIFFDPHGDGTVPLTLYYKLAEKYGYILIASNNSKNMVPFAQTALFADNLVEEARLRLHADENRISYCGFSGGAKVAMLNGATNPYIHKIIYAGANAEVQPTHPINVLGFAGVRDMNYTDLVYYDRDKELDNQHIQHMLVEWKGKHEFPSADVFEDAFSFLNTGTVKDYEKKRPTITDGQLEKENNEKKKYIPAFQNEDLNWWKKEIASLNARKNTDIMSERLLGFISLACYSFSNTLLQQHKLAEAEKVITVYKLADPGNKDAEEAYNKLQELKKGQ
jgi:predicted esterase